MVSRFSTFDWDDLRFFLAVARAGTLRGGAETLKANHATVSRRLTALEEGIEARLFDRTKTGLQLTQLGEDLLPYARKVEEEVSAASRLVAGRDARPSGPIKLSLPPVLTLSSVMEDLADFSEAHEDIDIHLDISNDRADLARREADITLRVAFEVTDDVVGRRLVQYGKGVYCSPDYAARMEDNGGRGLTWIGWNEPEEHSTADWVATSPYPNARLRHRMNEGVPQLSLAAAGMGLAMIPCFLGDRYPGLVRAPYHEPVLDRSIWLLFHGDLRRTARIRLFIDFLVARILSRRAEFVAGAT